METWIVFKTTEGAEYAVRPGDVFSVCGFNDVASVVKLTDGSEVEVKGGVHYILGRLGEN